jgi:hypothetical protein
MTFSRLKALPAGVPSTCMVPNGVGGLRGGGANGAPQPESSRLNHPLRYRIAYKTWRPPEAALAQADLPVRLISSAQNLGTRQFELACGALSMHVYPGNGEHKTENGLKQAKHPQLRV